MRRMLTGVVVAALIVAGCSTAVTKREYVLALTSLCAEANNRLAGVDPVVNPERYAEAFRQLVDRARQARTPEEAPTSEETRRELLERFSATADRFAAAAEAKERGDEAVVQAEADAARERLGQTQEVATEYGMPPLDQCDERMQASASPGAVAPSQAPSAAPTGQPSSEPAVADGWQRVTDARIARQQVAAAEVDGVLYVAGGLVRGSATRQVEALDPLLDQWRTAEPLPFPLHHAMAVGYENELVVIGGWRPQGNDVTAQVSDRAFRLTPDGWQELPRLGRPRAAGAAAVVDGQIVVVGGQNDDGLVTPTEIFDGSGWRDAAPIPTGREHLAAASDGQFVYAVGGRDHNPDTNVDVLERYDPAGDQWTSLPPMPTRRGSIDADIVDGRLVVAGGETPRRHLEVVEAYDIRSQRWTEFPSLAVPRHGAGVVAVGSQVYVVNGAEGLAHTRSSAAVEVLTPPRRQRQPTSWRGLNDAPFARQQMPVARVNGVLWVVGGLEDDGDVATSAVSGLDPQLEQWRNVSELPRPLHHAMAVNLSGRLVVMGGWAQEGDDPTAEVSGEVLALGDDGWEPLAPLRHPRAAAAAAVVDGQIVVVGGQRDNELVRQTEIYDPAADEWQEGAPIPTPREHLAAGAFDGSVYVVGGRDLGPDRNLDVLERYDVAADTWEQLEPMPTARGSIGATVAHGRLVVVGGETSNGVLDTVELYDFASGTWSAAPNLATPRHGAAVATRGPVVYVIGGAERTLHRGSSMSVEALDFK